MICEPAEKTGSNNCIRHFVVISDVLPYCTLITNENYVGDIMSGLYPYEYQNDVIECWLFDLSVGNVSYESIN